MLKRFVKIYILELFSHHSRSVTSFHIKIHYHFILNHLSLTNLFVQTVRFAMWAKPQGNSSPESMNTYWKTLSLEESRISNSMCNKDCFSVIDCVTTEYQLKMKESMHIKWSQPKLNKQVKHYTPKLIV